MSEGDLIDEWLTAEIASLRDVANTQSHPPILPLVTPALEVLRRYADGTVFYSSAQALLTNRADPGAVLLDVANVLIGWQAFRQTGLAHTAPVEAQARVIAATDLMEQVQRFLDDRSVHPAAPIVLSGAALEESLRSLVLDMDLEVKGKPGLQAYAEALKSASKLSAQDVKDVTAWAGLRNDAAHGRFDELSRERAQLMVDGINLFMRQRLTVTTS